ncbi:MAG TPA: response regulator [Candidatus Latescibacteria bacterium]|nr:response regulator [Candidatus Latescibacterota bacterium]
MLKWGAKTSAPFSIALLDVVMPEIDGFEVVQMIQQDAELDSAIVMMLSSLDDGSYMVRCRELDIELCICKSIS